MLTKANENFEKFSVLLEYVTTREASECRASQGRAPKGKMTITYFYQAKTILISNANLQQPYFHNNQTSESSALKNTRAQKLT